MPFRNPGHHQLDKFDVPWLLTSVSSAEWSAKRAGHGHSRAVLFRKVGGNNANWPIRSCQLCLVFTFVFCSARLPTS